jgi:integrase
VQVRRSYVRGRFGTPKSKYSRRKVPIDHHLVVALRDRHKVTEWPGRTDLVFPSEAGTPLQYSNVRRRVLVPLAEEAGVPWMGFHTLRHTAATRLFAAGRNAVQVQRWLGHHSAAFTLSIYVHLLDDDLGEALPSLQGSAEVAAAQADTYGYQDPVPMPESA